LSKKKHVPRRRPVLRKSPAISRRVSSYILEQGTPDDLQNAVTSHERLKKFWWDFHFELEYQRDLIRDRLLEAVAAEASPDYTFSSWQRAVPWKYSLNPLSCVGSRTNGGGRFNIGDIDPSRFLMFQALYLAENKDTAIQETLGQIPNSESGLSAREIALAAPNSETFVSVSGELDRVLDLTKPGSLAGFVELTKNFKIPASLRSEAKHIGLTPPEVIGSVTLLLETILDFNWKLYPMQFDLPSNSQILGQLARAAQLDGVVYPSKFTRKRCLAVFLSNFENGNSFIRFDHEAPPGVAPRRVDRTNWKSFESPDGP